MVQARHAERSANGSIIIRFCLSVLLLLAFCFHPTPAHAQVGSVSGLVLDQAGNPVRNATVLAILGPDAGRRATTDINGSYLLFNLTAGNYVLSATAPDLGTVEREIFVPSGTTVRVDFVLPTPTPVGGTVQGRVTDRNTGRPIPGATVELSSGLLIPILRTITNEAGFYRFDNLPIRTRVRVEASRLGFANQVRFTTVLRDEVTVLNFQLSPRPAALAILTGRVEDRDGEPIRNARVTLLVGASAGVSVRTNRFGNYRITNILPDVYDLEFSAPGFATEVANNVNLPGGQTTRFNAVLTSVEEFNADLEGVVTDTFGTPIEGARVRILAGPSGVGRSDFTGPAGDYMLEDLEPGEYTLEASATGFVTQTVVVNLVNDVITRQDFALIESGIGEFGAITGTVRSAADGTVLQNVLVQVTAGPVTGQSVLTDATGNFTLTNLIPGIYTLTFSRAGFETLIVPDVEVVAEETRVVNVSLTEVGAIGNITGVVRNANTGAVLAGVTVEALLDNVVITTTTTNAQGRFTLTGLAPGTFTLRFSRTGFQTLTRIGVVVQQGQTTTVNVQLQPSGTTTPAIIRGQVVGPTNQPIAQATVELRGPAGTRTITTNAQGAFEFTDITPNVNYTLTITATGFQTVSRTNLRPGSGETLDLQQIVLQPTSTGGGGIVGTVRDFQTGAPIGGATVRIRFGPAGVSRQVVTSANGQYVVGGLPGGFYILETTAAGYRTGSSGVYVNPTRTAIRDIFLRR